MLPEPAITAARYDARSATVIVSLSNGASVAFPPALVPGLAPAGDAALADVEVAGEGAVLHWPRLGVFLSYLALLTDVLGARAHIVRLAGPKLKTAEERAAMPARRRPRR